MEVIYELWDIPKIKECYMCINTEKNTELYECEKCGEYYCYNCCEQCANKNYE